MTTPKITPDQRAAFALGQFAGLSASASPRPGEDTDSATLRDIHTALNNAKDAIGSWNIVWGPVVAQVSGNSPAINTMYVAQNAKVSSQYTIAIAGTNFKSIIGSIVEDNFVEWQVPWVYDPFLLGAAQISLGTAVGLSILQNTTPSSKVPGGGSTLAQFLATITTTPVQITTVGHSLGGALAPTLALWLADTQGFSDWDRNRNATLSCLATAGPTAGNGLFALHSGAKLGSNLVSYYNTLDVVPHAWQGSMLAQIPSLYAPNISPLALSMLPIDGLVLILSLATQSGNYTTLPGLTPLSGAFTSVTGNTEFDMFMAELSHQHMDAYFVSDWFAYNKKWEPTQSKASVAPSSALVRALSTKTPTASDIAQALNADGPRKLMIGGKPVDAPSSPSDPRGAVVVAQVTAELQKHAGDANRG
jgi:pimeloyl-ACP methyl ester carboxylesterase